MKITVKMGGSRKYPYPYHRRHLGNPKKRVGYIDWNSKDVGGRTVWNFEVREGLSILEFPKARGL